MYDVTPQILRILTKFIINLGYHHQIFENTYILVLNKTGLFLGQNTERVRLAFGCFTELFDQFLVYLEYFREECN